VNSFATSGPDWYLMRGSGVVSLILLTVVVALGIATANRWRAGQPRFVTLSLHRNASLLAVVFLAIHVLTGLIDPYAAVTIP
jgi:methionine sulfoxide reductase heme-binding subunit